MPPKKKEEGFVSAFERRRLENIAANNALLRDLSETAAKILPTPKPEPKKRRAPAAAPARRTRTLRETAQPTRRSSRVAGLDADDETLKRKAEVEAEALGETARQKRARVSGDLQLGDIKVEGRKWESGVDGMAGLKGLGLGLPARGAQPGVRTFKQEDIDDTPDQGLKDLRLRMSGLKLYEKWAVNGTINPLTPRILWRLLTARRYQDCSPTNIFHGPSPNLGQTHHICRRQGGRHGGV
jgi:hypothetical protein